MKIRLLKHNCWDDMHKGKTCQMYYKNYDGKYHDGYSHYITLGLFRIVIRTWKRGKML